MCGIVGFLGEFDVASLIAAQQTLRHRGPDGNGTFLDEISGAGLAHVRLSILDLSPSGAQPMASDDGDVVLTFNGEIYNYRELKADLSGAGHRFRGHSDTEVLLHLYLRHGKELLGRLNGIFAFAIWDKRNQSLFVARDALGVKPVYFCESPRGFAFASEIKSLVRLVPGLNQLDIPSIHRYLSFLWCPGEGTPLRGVRKLLPGEALVVRDGRIAQRWNWYQLPACREVEPVITKEAAVAGAVDGLRRAVQRQLVADVPVGAFLSGGLDSSAVVAFAREQKPDIRCFTIESAGGAEEGTADDLPYARRAAEHLGVQLEVIRVDADSMAADIEQMIYQLDEPLADPAALNVLYISQGARQQGIKVLLSGAGGDDLFTGYRRHVAVRYQHIWQWLPHAVRARLDRWSGGLDQRNSIARRANRIFSGADLDGDARLAGYFAWARERDLKSFYSPAFLAALGESAASQPMLDFLSQLPGGVGPLDRVLALEQRFFLADHNLVYTDKMSMAAGVEVRVPFLDIELVEFAARIPVALKQRGRTGKWVLKKAMEPFLPQDLIYRPKAGFGVPLRRWMRNELRPLLSDLLSTQSLARRGLFDPVAVQKLIERNDRGAIDGAYTLLALLGIEIWCRRFVDQQGL